MKLRLLLCGLAAFSGLAGPVRAGQLIPELVPAEARWLAHYDLEALHGSALFQALPETGEGSGGDGDLDPLGLQFILGPQLGVDPFEVIRSVTFFCTQAEPETGVAVMVVSEKAEEILARYEKEPSSRTIQVRGRELLTWGDANPDDGGSGETVYAYVRRFEGVANRLVYASNGRDDLMAAVDVLESGKPDITDASLRHMHASPGSDSIFFVETSERVPMLEGIEPRWAVDALAGGLRFDLGETKGELHLELALTAKNALDARGITLMLQSLSALASLLAPALGGQEISEHEEQELKSLIKALHFSAHGSAVEADFRYDSRRLIQSLRDLHWLQTDLDLHGKDEGRSPGGAK